MAFDGVMAADYAPRNRKCNPPRHSSLRHARAMSYVGKNVRWYMRQHDLTEIPAANALGVSQSTINRIVNPGSSRPNRDPNSSTLGKIAQAMGTTVDALVNVDFETHGLQPAMQSQSQPVKLDRGTLAVALVAVERAIRARGLDPEYAWGHLAPLVLWAIDLQGELYPDGVRTKADQRGFDAQVMLEMDSGGYGGFGRTEQKTAGSDAGTAQAAPARAKAGRGGRIREH